MRAVQRAGWGGGKGGKGWDRGVSTQRHKTRGYRPSGRGRCSAEGVAVVASKRPLGPRRSPSIPDQPRGLVGKKEGGGWLGYIIWYREERERERAKSMMLGRVFFKGGIVEEAPLCRARHDVTGEEASGQDALWTHREYMCICIYRYTQRLNISVNRYNRDFSCIFITYTRTPYEFMGDNNGFSYEDRPIFLPFFRWMERNSMETIRATIPFRGY